MKIIYKLKPFLILMVFLITFLFCKKSNSKTTNKFLEEKIVQKENKIVLEVCDFNKSDIRVSLLKDENNEIYLSIKEKGREVIERKLDLENFNELASINLKCSNDDTFQLFFLEKLGNNYQTLIHSFHKKNNSIFILNTVYVQTSDRNGISLFYGKLKPTKISDYDSSILIEPEYKEIYSFLGFQEHKVPIIDKYYENIKRLAITKNKDIQLYVNNYVLDYILNTIEINSNNLSKYNDIAYYSEQSGLYKEAVYLLEKIIKKYPNRTEAYINLGDSYWGLGKKEEAKEAYKKYVEQMKVNGKEKKIPKRVLQKITE